MNRYGFTIEDARDLLDADLASELDAETVSLNTNGSDPEVEAECVTLARMGYRQDTIETAKRFALRLLGF